MRDGETFPRGFRDEIQYSDPNNTFVYITPFVGITADHETTNSPNKSGRADNSPLPNPRVGPYGYAIKAIPNKPRHVHCRAKWSNPKTHRDLRKPSARVPARQLLCPFNVQPALSRITCNKSPILYPRRHPPSDRQKRMVKGALYPKSSFPLSLLLPWRLV